MFASSVHISACVTKVVLNWDGDVFPRDTWQRLGHFWSSPPAGGGGAILVSCGWEPGMPAHGPDRESNWRPAGCMRPRTAMNAARPKIINLLKTFFSSSVFVSVCVFSVWPKTTLLPVWPRDAKKLDTPAATRTDLRTEDKEPRCPPFEGRGPAL